MLIYYCATNYRALNVLNGQEKGGNVQVLKELQMRPETMPGVLNVLLDDRTGDFFSLNSV